MESRPCLLFYVADHRSQIIPIPVRKDQLSNVYTIDLPLLEMELKNFALYEMDSELLQMTVLDIITWDATIRSISNTLLNCSDCLSRIIVSEGSPQQQTGRKKINILFAHTHHLRRNEFYHNLLTTPAPRGLRCVSSDVNTKTVWNINKFLPSPIITISEEDLMKLYSETTAREYKMDRESWKKEREKNNTLYRLNIDHRIKFLDSSIWHRFVSEKDGSGSIGIVDQNKEFKQKIKETCISMCDYWEMGLYNTNVGLAALEFQCRMFLQSWLFPIGHRDHQDVVTPFKFHSESEAVKNVHELLHFLKSEGNGELKMSNLEWHLLMVDDQATKPISSIDNNSCTITKANLIRYLIQGHKPAGFDGDLSIRDGLQKAMIVEQTGRGDEDKGIVRQGIQSLREKMYDIILLDYLLGQQDTPDSLTSPQGLREYGHEFLLELEEQLRPKMHDKKDDRPSLKRGPVGKYWIFPISSFPFAFSDKLRQLSIDTANEYWHISTGGDPINCPEQFRWNFYQFLMYQVSKFYLYPAALLRWIDQFTSIGNTSYWCQAIQRLAVMEKLKYKSLSSDEALKSGLAPSMRSFLDKQSEYWDVLSNIIGLCQLYEKFSEGNSPKELLTLLKTAAKGSGRFYPVLSEIIEKIKREIHAPEHELISLMKNLQKIDFQKKHLCIIPLEFCEDNIMLNELNLSYNCLYFLPSQFDQLQNLRKIELRNNYYEGIPFVLSKLKNLSYLDMRGNPFTQKHLPLEFGIDSWLVEGQHEIQKLFLRKELLIG